TALALRISRPLDWKLQATLHDRAERNVGNGEAIEREPPALGDVAIEYFKLGEEIGALPREIARALRRGLLGVSEHGDIRRVQGAEQQVHPTLDHGALGRARSGQRRPMDGGEIAKDGMGFPDHEIAVDQGRNLRRGVELAVCLGQRVAELAAVVLANIGQPEFLQAEDDLLHVSRRLSAEQSDHVTSSSVDERRNDFRFAHQTAASPPGTPPVQPRGLYAMASISILVSMTARASTVVRASTASLKCSPNTRL